MTAKTPEQKSTVFLSGGMITVIIGIVILVIALIALGMVQQGQHAAGQPTVQPAQQPTMVPVKSARPAVDLFVMSWCPYGTLAETAMSPVYDLLKSKADVRVRYITTVSGSTVDSVQSLHGPKEAREDLRQVCINKYYPDQFWSYLKTYNERCNALRNETVLVSCHTNITAALSMDRAKIDSCAAGTEGISLLKTDAAAAQKDGARASPMLFINGVLYSGARSPEAYKQAICDAFETVPAECSAVLSSTASSSAVGKC